MAFVAKQALAELRVTGPARRDLAAISRWSLEHFGEAAALRYGTLIAQALRDLQADPARPGSKERPDIMIPSARTYHLALSRSRVTGGKVKEPRHFVVYRYREGVLEVIRILHDSRDLERHLPDNYKKGSL
jgi:toxin ParE1/3/4